MSDLSSAKSTLDAYSQAVSAIVEAAAPAVVRVQSMKGKRGRRHDSDWKPGRARTNHGSGFIIDAEAGIIVTNFHVVHGAKHVAIHLYNGEALRGEVIGADANVDMAVIKITTETPLTALSWGDSDALQTGHFVLALGNPDGDSIVATSGIVSTLGQKLRGPSGRLLEDLVQTNAIFNPGMSGGPLLNGAGEVIGINTASLVEAQGINLAIASNAAQKIADDLVNYGAIKQPVLGIAGERQRLYEGLVRHHDLKQTHGVYVHEVKEEYPAHTAGVKAGDLLIGADERVVEGLDDLHRILTSKQIGDTIQLRVLRDLDLLDLEVSLDVPPENKA